MRKNASRPDDENPAWTVDDVRRARPLMEVLPKATAEAVRRYRGQRGPQKSPTKELISLRVDRDLVAAFRATGAGWQQRVSDALRVYANKNGLTPRAGSTRAEASGRAYVRRRRSSSR
jgi:uncharacterized protein (DUF4415 family)